MKPEERQARIKAMQYIDSVKATATTDEYRRFMDIMGQFSEQKYFVLWCYN